MTIPAPRDPFSEVVDKDRRWTPEWYTWLQQFTAAAGGIAVSGVPVAGQLARWVSASSIEGFTSPYAPIASPVFTGDPQAPTPSVTDSDTSIATTAFVKNSLAYVNIVNYGGVGDGTTDNTTAFAAALAALGARGGTIFFPRGSFKFASLQTVSYTLNALYDLTLLGEGPDATSLLWPAGVDGIRINFNSNTSKSTQAFHARDLSIVSADNTPSQIGVLLNQSGTLNGAYTAYTEFTRVSIMGSDGPVGSNGWGTGVKCVDVSNVQFTGCALFGTATASGTGVSWEGTNASNIATGLYFNDCAINQFTTGILMLDFVQGMYLTACQINGCTVGLDLTGGAHAVGADIDSAVSIVNSEFGVYATNANAITMTNPVAFLQIDSTNFNMAQIAGPAGFIVLAAMASVQITNCSMIAPGWPGGASTIGTKLTGISLAGTESGATIVANNLIAGFFGNGTGVNASVPLVIQASANKVLVEGNFFVGNQFQAGISCCVNNAGGANISFIGNYYDNGFGPVTSGFASDHLQVRSDQTSTIIGSISGAFGVNLGNQHAAAGDNAVAIFGGPQTGDSTTIMIDFVSSNAVTTMGSIKRFDGTGLQFNGTNLNISGGTNTSNLQGSVNAAFQTNIGNLHNASGDHGIAVFAGASTAADVGTVIVDFLTPSPINLCGSITRADAAGVRNVAYNVTSDIRLKKNIRQTEKGLEHLRQIRVIEHGPEDDRVQAFLAQEVAEVYPEAVTPGNDERPWQMDYGRMTPLLAQAIKDLSDKVERLEAELRNRS